MIKNDLLKEMISGFKNQSETQGKQKSFYQYVVDNYVNTNKINVEDLNIYVTAYALSPM